MSNTFEPQKDCDIDNAIGTIRQLIFFMNIERQGVALENCVSILSQGLYIPENEALRLLYCIGRMYDYDKPLPDNLKKYLLEEGRSILA